MSKIETFIDWYNAHPFSEFTNFDIEDYLKEVREATELFFKNEKRNYIGASLLGKPLIVLALKKLNLPQADGSQFSNKTMTIFHYGHIFEALLINLLKEHGLYVSDQQKQVVHKDFPDYKGHIDGIVNGNTLIEVKTMNSKYFESFKKEPDNFRGYYTQLAFYFHGLVNKNVPLTDCGWLCFNKETFEIAFVRPDREKLLNQYLNIEHKLSTLENVKTILDLVKIPLPKLKEEVYKRNTTGKFLPPMSFRFNPYYECFFNHYVEIDKYGKEKRYVDVECPPDNHEIVQRVIDTMHQLS